MWTPRQLIDIRRVAEEVPQSRPHPTGAMTGELTVGSSGTQQQLQSQVEQLSLLVAQLQHDLLRQSSSTVSETAQPGDSPGWGAISSLSEGVHPAKGGSNASEGATSGFYFMDEKGNLHRHEQDFSRSANAHRAGLLSVAPTEHQKAKSIQGNYSSSAKKSSEVADSEDLDMDRDHDFDTFSEAITG